MGCWDIFCFMCGNPCHSMFKDSVDFFLNEIKFYNENKNSKEYKNKLKELEKWDTKYNSDKDIIKKIKNLIKNTNWMNKCTMLLATNEIIHDCKETACNIKFRDKNNNYYIHDPSGVYKDENMSYGVYIHTDCWKFINNTYGIKLKYGDLPISESKDYYKTIDYIDYNIIEKYWGQEFNFINTIIDGNEYLCSSPLNNDKNITFIKSIFAKLKIRTDRSGPTSSGTFYKNNCYKIGENNNIWYTKNNKWFEIKQIEEITMEYPISQLSNSKFIKTLKYIGETNSKPIFVKSITHKNNKTIVICYIKMINQTIK